MIFLDFVFSHERPTRGTFVEGPRESMIGVVAHNLAKCGEILCQVEFGIGLLVGIVVVATGATVLTTVVTSITATSIAIALLTLVPLEAGDDLLATLGSWLLVCLLLGLLFFFFFCLLTALSRTKPTQMIA